MKKIAREYSSASIEARIDECYGDEERLFPRDSSRVGIDERSHRW
ncbi:MAG TPA: hypothetical protein VII75_15195 [Thermoanaerobaculia bacterium]